ncbi:MAG: hypothetical protein IJY33_04705 [Oscillospiraceae bacterium]|nr:hypothetical protein [Oscillospiraceae bacterium]
MNQTTEQKSAPDLRKILSKVFAVILCFLCAVVTLSAIFVSVLAFSKTSENTAQIFSYKIYVAEYDIESADIEEGSLVIVKNTEDDEFYTPEMLEKAIVIKNVGKIIKQESLSVTLVFAVPFMFLFALVLLRELRKSISRAPEESKVAPFTVQQEQEEFEEQTA